MLHVQREILKIWVYIDKSSTCIPIRNSAGIEYRTFKVPFQFPRFLSQIQLVVESLPTCTVQQIDPSEWKNRTTKISVICVSLRVLARQRGVFHPSPHLSPPLFPTLKQRHRSSSQGATLASLQQQRRTHHGMVGTFFGGKGSLI